MKTGSIPKQALQARVVHIHKKGPTRDFHNYRPISLLNVIYNIFSSVLHQRLKTVIDPHLSEVQYGFRPQRGTRDAIHILRRIMDQAEHCHQPLSLIFLDWSKAFDRVTPKALLNSLERYQVPPIIPHPTRKHVQRRNLLRKHRRQQLLI